MTAPHKPRRLVFINHTPPNSGDVSSLRMTRFAETFAERGDQVLLLTCTQSGDGLSLEQADQRLHDSRPGTMTVLTCRPREAAWATKARTGQLPTPLRLAVIATHYALGGGMFPDWRKGAAAYLPSIITIFNPEIVIGTFGNTDTWRIAQTLARRSNTPWVADMKDNWGAFLPKGFAKLTAQRFADTAHLTVYSKAHLAEANRWFRGEKTVVYSGYDHLTTTNDGAASEPGKVTLIGSIYDGTAANIALRGLANWQSSRSQDVTLSYAGHDGDRIAAMAATLAPDISVEILGSLPPNELSARMQRSMANVYTVNPSSLFQQKPLELLAAGRPVIAVPGEGLEAHEIAREIGGKLTDAASPEAFADALSEIEGTPFPAVDLEALNAYTWARQADILSGVIARILEGSA